MSGATVFTVLRDHHAAPHPLLQVRADYARSIQHVCTQRGKSRRLQSCELTGERKEMVAERTCGTGWCWTLQELTHDDAQQAKGE